MTLQEFYARVGGDYNATLSRLPSEALVKKFILKYPGDPSFAQLKDALAAQEGAGFPRQPHTEGRGPELRDGPPVQGCRGPVRRRARPQAAGR